MRPAASSNQIVTGLKPLAASCSFITQFKSVLSSSFITIVCLVAFPSLGKAVSDVPGDYYAWSPSGGRLTLWGRSDRRPRSALHIPEDSRQCVSTSKWVIAFVHVSKQKRCFHTERRGRDVFNCFSLVGKESGWGGGGRGFIFKIWAHINKHILTWELKSWLTANLAWLSPHLTCVSRSRLWGDKKVTAATLDLTSANHKQPSGKFSCIYITHIPYVLWVSSTEGDGMNFVNKSNSVTSCFRPQFHISSTQTLDSDSFDCSHRDNSK